MQSLNRRTPSLLGLCNTSTHTCDKKHKLSYFWLQDHPWRFRLLAPLMTREGNNFYKTESWDSSRNNTGRRHKRAFWVQNPRCKRGPLFSLESLIKTCLGFPLYTRRSRSETLILFGLNEQLGLNKNSADMCFDQLSLSLDRSNQAASKFFFLQLVLESWLESP